MTFKIFNKRQKLDPKAQQFLNKFREILKSNGITEQQSIEELSVSLVMISKDVTQNDSDVRIKILEHKFRTLLTLYGISDKEEQTTIITGFFNITKDISPEAWKA